MWERYVLAHLITIVKVRWVCSCIIYIRMGNKYSGKLNKLRTDHLNAANDTLERSESSRKIIAQKYVKDVDDGEVKGAPFPKILEDLEEIDLLEELVV